MTRPGAEGVRPDAPALADWLLSLDRQELEHVLDRQQTTWDVDSRCYVERHAERLADADGRPTDRSVSAPATPDLTADDERLLRAAFRRQQPGKVTLLPANPGPVPHLHVPAEGTCDRPPPATARREMRDAFPDAVGVSGCALLPGHDSLHVGLLWLPSPGEGACRAHQVLFPDVGDAL